MSASWAVPTAQRRLGRILNSAFPCLVFPRCTHLLHPNTLWLLAVTSSLFFALSFLPQLSWSCRFFTSLSLVPSLCVSFCCSFRPAKEVSVNPLQNQEGKKLTHLKKVSQGNPSILDTSSVSGVTYTCILQLITTCTFQKYALHFKDLTSASSIFISTNK